MTGAVPAATCKREGCDNLVEQAPGSHRPRQYCSDTCKQSDYRQRAKEKLLAQRQAKLRERWGDLLPETLEQLDIMLRELGEEAVEHIATMGASEVKERLEEAERALSRYRQLIDLDADICPWTPLTPVQEYLRDHDETVPFRRQGRTIRVFAIDNHGRAVSDRHGLIRLNDEEIEQCRLYVLKKLGQPIIVTVHPVGDGGEDSEPLEAEEQSELQQAQARILDIEQQLARYRQICDLSDRERLEQQFLDIGEQIGYRMLITADDVGVVGEGSEFWRAFAMGADDDLLARTVVRARHYAKNLVWVDAQTS